MQSLDKLTRPIVKPAFEKFGFAGGDLVTQWSAIVGDVIASQCAPGRMVWPKGRSTEKQRAEGATLTIRAGTGAALALSYETGQMIERINSFYGYRAVDQIKIVKSDHAVKQATTRHQQAPADEEVVQAVEIKTAEVKDNALRDALTRLGEASFMQSRNRFNS